MESVQEENDQFWKDVECVLPGTVQQVAEPVEKEPLDAPGDSADAVETDVPDGAGTIDPASVAETAAKISKQKRISAPNYRNEEVVASVWAYIAMSEE